jgi:hypothetical protein
MTTYTFERGETVRLALDAIEGDTGLVSEISARMRQKVGGSASADFAVTPRAAIGEIPAGWDLVIAAEVTAVLPATVYSADARLVVAGGVEVTSPVEVRLNESASGEAP